MKKQLKFAIVGCGLIGQKRANALTGLGHVAIVCDTNLSRAQLLANSLENCVACNDAEEIWQNNEVQAVIIATLNSSLAPLALAAINSGKNVLVEKPGAISSAELRNLTEAADAAGVMVRIGYNHRFHPAIQKARSIVDDGALGTLMFLRGRYGHGGRKGYETEWRADSKLSGGGELIDQGVHLIDLAGWFLGKFSKIEGHAVTNFWNMPVDDNAFISLRTRDEQTAWLHVSCTEWKNLFSLEIYGRNGKLAVEGLGGSYGVERLTFYRMLPEMGPPETMAWEYPRGDNSWRDEMQVFIEDITSQRRPDPGLAEGTRTLEIVEHIYHQSNYSTKQNA